MRTLKMTPECVKSREYYRQTYADPEKRKRIRELARNNYMKHLEQRREKARQRYAKDPKYYQSKTNEWSRNHVRATNAGSIARRNVPLKDHCEICGAKENVVLERHHPDYSQRFFVLTLCRFCHKRIHIEEKERKLLACNNRENP